KYNIKKFVAGISALCVMSQAVPVISAADTVTLYGDADLDGSVTISDAVQIMQSIVNPDKFGFTGQGADNADVYNRGDGITTMDALAIQKLILNLIPALPESWQDGTETPSADATKIHLNNDSITVDGDYTEVNGTTVTITHSGTFYIDGTLNDGQININIPDETADPDTVKIFLNGVNITGKSAPAILVTNAENTSVNLVDGTENFISDGDTAYAGDNLGCAVIEAKDDITFKGSTGILNITANTQDGIVCNNDIKINGGIITVNTLNATDKTDAIKGKKSVTVKDGTLNIEAEGDGLKSSKGSVSVQGGLLNIKAGNDAVQAETTIDISGGTVIAGGDRGLTSVTGTNITGGTVIATATDNQTDSALMSGTTQGTILLNCIASSETDGCWKKANNLTVGNVKAFKWQKKYSYVLISDASITADGSYKLTNSSTGAGVTHDGSEDFKMSGTVAVFDNVNPAGTGSTTTTPDTTAGYTVTLSADSIKTDAPADVATVENNVLTIKKPAVMSVTGENKGGQIVIDVDKTTYPDGVVELDLNGMNLTNESVAPIYVASIGDEVQIVAKSGTDNTISDGTTHTDSYTDSDGNINQINGAIFSRDDLKLKGSGNLTVNGNTADGIVSKNDLKIYNGNVTVNAVDDGVRGKDSVTIGNDTATDYSTLKLSINTKSGDGIKSSSSETGTKAYGVVTINGGTVDIKSYADGIQAEQDFVMNGGDLNIYTYQGSAYTGNGSTSSGNTGGWGGGFGGGMQDGNSNKTDISAKGIKSVGIYDTAGTTWQSGGNITINGGNITVDSSDDSLHCGGQMNINGGTFRLSSADDALHSDHDLILGKDGGTYSDFNIYIPKCYEGVEGGNIYQHSGTVVVKSGDDGYNAAGGADGSGTGNNNGWNQGGRPGGMGGGMMGGSSGNILEITGGIAIVQSASGDHDGFDSNGPVNISGGVVIANGQEPIDCGDGYSENITGGTVVECSSQGTGAISANTQFTVADSSGNVIVSFTTMQNMGSPSFSSGSGLTCYTGGTISGGTDLILSDDSQTVYGNGTISGGTTVSAGTSSGGNQGGWGNGGRW
ncbi:MAG: carbohydrate-binding domain-containing protein, partial [Ruminococcus sp.]|nr:carbohydrate-binding domain-containing protein [Ruminococcus sp.]